MYPVPVFDAVSVQVHMLPDPVVALCVKRVVCAAIVSERFPPGFPMASQFTPPDDGVSQVPSFLRYPVVQVVQSPLIPVYAAATAPPEPLPFSGLLVDAMPPAGVPLC